MNAPRQEGDADSAFWSRHSDVDAVLRARIDGLRPRRPFWIDRRDPAELARWAFAWRAAAAYAVALQAHAPERELRAFVWSAALAIYLSRIQWK